MRIDTTASDNRIRFNAQQGHGTCNEWELDDHLTLRPISAVRDDNDTGCYDNTSDVYARTSQLLHYTDRP